MAQFDWDSRYSVNVDCLDDDHQELFRILQTLYDAMMTRRPRAVVQSVLDELVQYTEGHFAREEEVLREAGYPKLQAQIEQHRCFVEKIEELSTRYKAGKLSITVELLDFLTEWLKEHIVGMDQQYGEFLKARGVT